MNEREHSVPQIAAPEPTAGPGEPASDPTVQTNDDEQAEPLPHCSCGTDRLSKYSVVDREYSFVRTLYLLWGGTSVPTKVSFRCVKCGDTFESTSQPGICREHIK